MDKFEIIIHLVTVAVTSVMAYFLGSIHGEFKGMDKVREIYNKNDCDYLLRHEKYRAT